MYSATQCHLTPRQSIQYPIICGSIRQTPFLSKGFKRQSSCYLCFPWPPFRTKPRSISTVEGSGATCTKKIFEFFFKTGDLSMVQLTQKIQKISKKWKKGQKCIDITLHKWSWRPLWQVGKKSISRFHSQPGALFGWFCNFPHQVRCEGGLEKCQTTQKGHLVGCGNG